MQKFSNFGLSVFNGLNFQITWARYLQGEYSSRQNLTFWILESPTALSETVLKRLCAQVLDILYTPPASEGITFPPLSDVCTHSNAGSVQVRITQIFISYIQEQMKELI